MPMNRSPGLDLADHVRWLDSDAHSLWHEFNNHGTVALSQLDNIIRMAQNTKKCLRKQQSWKQF